MSSPVRVLSLGRFAQAALGSGEARVIAVFERSAYVEAPAGLACIGAVGNGPLNAVCDALPQLTVGEPVATDHSGSLVWHPVSPGLWSAASVARGLQALRDETKGKIESKGFGALIDRNHDRPAPVRGLEQWLVRPLGVPDAAGLIGLGPGLTPSGDDLLGGALCALHAIGQVDTAKRLADWALPRARLGTSRISYAHLACAAEGECGESVNDAIVSLMEGRLPNLDRIDAIGHTSGWDALAGVALALRNAQET